MIEEIMSAVEARGYKHIDLKMTVGQLIEKETGLDEEGLAAIETSTSAFGKWWGGCGDGMAQMTHEEVARRAFIAGAIAAVIVWNSTTSTPSE